MCFIYVILVFLKVIEKSMLLIIPLLIGFIIVLITGFIFIIRLNSVAQKIMSLSTQILLIIVSLKKLLMKNIRKGSSNYIIKCFSSLFNPRNISYHRKKDIDITKNRIAVIIQKMIDIDEDGKIENKIGNKKKIVKSDEINGVKIIELRDPLSKKTSLNNEEIERLSRIAETIQEIFGFPQDIEFSIKDDNIFIL